MPSASNKLEKQASLEVSEPFKLVLSVIEKKVRNLEKRKAKLDALKAQPGELHDQQKEALTKYEEVVNTLEFSRELVKNIGQISLDAAKNQKRQAKREQMEHQLKEISRVKEVLMINNVLSTMGEEKTREDFLAGKNGAKVLTDEDLQRMDNLFKLVTPTRTPEEEDCAPYEQQLTSASEHLVAILDGRKKEVLGTTYLNLKELIFGVHDCDYFKPQNEKDASNVNGENHDGNVESDLGQVINASSEEKPSEPVSVTEVTGGNITAGGEKEEISGGAVSESTVPEVGVFQTEDNSVFSTFTHNKPYTEVFTSSQGSFNFLQESQIDPDSPHMDPAVVAAHPMVPNPNSRQMYPNPVQSSELLPQQFNPNQTVGEAQQLVLSSNSSGVIPQSHYIQPVTAITATHPIDFSQIPTQTYTNQHYVAVPTFAAPIYGGQVSTQPVAQTAKIASDEGNWSSESKKHYMNVNATAFESMNYKGDEQETNNEENSNVEQQNTEQAQKFSSNNDNQGYQSGNQNNYQQRSGYNYRVGNGRGSSGGSRGSRGGPNSSYNGGGGNGGRGNMRGSGGAGAGGGGGSYQGYRDQGYNNFQRENNSGFSNNGGPRRGMNGASRGNRGGGGMNSRGGNYSKTSA